MRVHWIAIVSWLMIVGRDSAAEKLPTTPAEFFTSDKVWNIHLTLPAEEYQAIQATNRRGIAAVFGPRQKAKTAPDPDRPKSISPFGFEFPYGRATFEIDGYSLNEIGIRYKGNSSYATARGLKRPFKIDFDRYVDGQKFAGLSMFNLSNNVMDPSHLRETLAYSTFRAAGTPASRTTFAQVHLTVPGEHEKVYLGLYTVVECVDKHFLKERFGNSKGLLVKPEKAGGLPYLGEDWPRYSDQYNAKSDAKPEEARRLIEFVKLVNKADDAEFNEKIHNFLEVDSFLRLAAANSLLTNLDSFFGLGHNYYIYLNPDTNKFTIIPWDLDHSFGALGMLGTVDQMMDWSIRKPYAGDNRLVKRLFAIPGIEEQFQQHVKTLVDGPFCTSSMEGAIDSLKKVIQSAVDIEPRRPTGNRPAPKIEAAAKDKAAGKAVMPTSQRAPDLKTFVKKRVTSVNAQLAGRSDGQDIRGFTLFGGKPKPGLGRPLADVILKAAADSDSMLSLEEFEAGAKSWLEKQKKEPEVATIAAAISKAAPPQAAAGTPHPRAIAEAFWKRVTGSGDFPATRDAVMNAVAQCFKEWDSNTDGKLDREELFKGIDGLTSHSEKK